MLTNVTLKARFLIDFILEYPYIFTAIYTSSLKQTHLANETLFIKFIMNNLTCTIYLFFNAKFLLAVYDVTLRIC